MYFDESAIYEGCAAIERFLVPERISVNAMIQNKIHLMSCDSRYQEKPEVQAALKELFEWLQVPFLQDLERLGELLGRTYHFPLEGV